MIATLELGLTEFLKITVKIKMFNFDKTNISNNPKTLIKKSIKSNHKFKLNQLHAISRTQQGSERELSVTPARRLA